MTCNARQYSDSMVCRTCHLVWDVNDEHPPPCKERGDIMRDLFNKEELELIFDVLNLELGSTESDEQQQKIEDLMAKVQAVLNLRA